MIELKDCPFCGSDKVLLVNHEISSIRVACLKCTANVLGKAEFPLRGDIEIQKIESCVKRCNERSVK